MKNPLLFIAAIAFTLAGALWSIQARVSVEQRNKRTALSAEWQTLVDLANGRSMPESLAHLKQMGLTHVVLNEETLGDWISDGRITLETKDGRVRAICGGVHRGILADVFDAKFERGLFPTARQIDEETFSFDLGRPIEELRSLGMGLNREEAHLVREAGLGIIARHANSPSMSHAGINWTLNTSKQLGASIYLSLGDQVLGQRENVERTAEVLATTDMLYATIEFGKTAGDADLSRLAKDRLVRLHSAQKDEVDKMSPATYVERFVKASRERSIRVLLLRPLSVASDNGITSFGDTIQTVAKQIVREGGDIGTPKPFAEPTVSKLAFILIGLGAFVGSLWVMPHLLPNRGMLIGGVLGGLALLCSISDSYRGMTAFGAAFLFPVMAYAAWSSLRGVPAAVQFFAMSMISLVGGLAVAGLLNSLDYYVRLRQFEMVKLAHFGPIFLVAVWMLSRHINFKEAMKSPMTYGSLLIGFVGVLALGFMMVRTGNDGPGGVSSLELKLRSLLEQFLYVRPRTKEIFIGHPALMFGLLALAARKKTGDESMSTLGLLALTVGAIGQTSIVNTMCHIHTPVDIGLARILIGLLIGGIFGFVAYLGWNGARLGIVRS